ncbi:LptF/LptG family permease [Halpernia frigidisoli]|uniref:Lipopolysaccharide export system permease protein n=1 Tax=Halpernia frigidisoli TaxID=1125876 RepID=A0A1I3GP49_9FLAO|nr:LptF/LptG family permease [Halpernia frigidisoli]SFI25265.1 lipopolysaccharide export system permease protein [Halpernia frigidisoli]
MKILDKYIIKNFLGTFGFIMLLLTVIVLVIDVQEKVPRIQNSGFTVSYFLIHYYPFYIVYLLVTFIAIIVFISVIFFTSKLANNTEIVAIISSGASFHRFARPYLMTSLFIATIFLSVSHFALPLANTKKNVLDAYTYSDANREKILGNVSITTQLSPNEYIFINNYNKKEKRGSGFSYQKYDKNKKLIYQISASDVSWQAKKNNFELDGYLEKTVLKNDAEILKDGAVRNISFGHPPEELFPDQLLGQNKTTPELIKFIAREREKGNGNLNTYLNELYQRTSMPVSIIILTFLALSLSSQKKRGGLGINLAIGIALAFIFVFSFEALKVVSENKTLTPLMAMWLPNMVFAPLAAFLYLKRANQ